MQGRSLKFQGVRGMAIMFIEAVAMLGFFSGVSQDTDSN